MTQVHELPGTDPLLQADRAPRMDPSPQARPGRRGTVLGFAGLGLSVALVACLHVLAAGTVSPVSQTISDYAFAPSGWLLGVSAAGLSVAGLGALLGLAGIGLLASLGLRAAFAVLLLGSVLVAVFPTDRAGVSSPSAFIHRYAAGLVFFSLPIAGLLVATALTTRPRYAGVPALAGYARALRRTVACTWACLAFFLSAHLRLMPEVTRDVLGVAERVLFALELLVLAQLIYLPVRAAGLREVRS